MQSSPKNVILQTAPEVVVSHCPFDYNTILFALPIFCTALAHKQ